MLRLMRKLNDEVFIIISVIKKIQKKIVFFYKNGKQ